MMAKKQRKSTMLFQKPIPTYLEGSFLLKMWIILYLSCTVSMLCAIRMRRGARGKH
jgi:hypothetical protein